MGYSDEQLSEIYDRTSGKCHICHRPVVFKNHGVHGARGAWHVDHSKPRARGGTDHGNNLVAAHIRCNLEKGAGSNRSARGRHGTRRRPMSVAQREAARSRNAVRYAIGCAVAGAYVAGPAGAVVGLIGGYAFGGGIEPEDE